MTSKKSNDSLAWPGDKVRQTFLGYFAERGHKIVPSASLVPGDDLTLLFTNAGMVQFKDVFMGTGSRPYTRAVDSQKCMRVAGKHNDLDDVGRDDSHHTFFEMLGNWSFGDYYKEEAISWAWQLMTEVWGLPKDRLWATVFEDEKGEIPRDEEAAGIWSRQPGIDTNKILFFGREENFWEMADVGPCGPDSEIHFDRGLQFCDKQNIKGHVCQVNGDCGRYLELWNLVFIQYNRTSPTDLVPLPKKHVDTGLGFERVVSVLQGVDSNYKTDLFSPMMDQIQSMVGQSDQEREDHLTSYQVIADHSRAAAFLIADGVVPGNTGRNYVCRMVIRRASRFGGKLGFNEPFLAQVADTVIENYGEVYPELKRNRTAILSTISDEERRFHHTLDIGLARLQQQLGDLKSKGGRVLPGEEAFDLYATYGLPLEISQDIAREEDLEIEQEGFALALETHRFASGTGKTQDTMMDDVDFYRGIYGQLVEAGHLDSEGVNYDPYQEMAIRGHLLAIVKDGQQIEEAQPDDVVHVVIPKTNFYIEAGGQVTDKGTITSTKQPHWEIEIRDVFRPLSGFVVHQGIVTRGNPKVGDEVQAVLSRTRRWDIMRNHTATHLLHAGLQRVLGEHARQAGSLVAPDRLRFDFTHPQAMTEEQIQRVESFVNEAILADHKLEIHHKSQEEALGEGAMALFGESYGEIVRTIKIGDTDRISYELCGGTHVPRTGIIGPFFIVSEGSVAAGIRRVEAVTGRGALELIRKQRAALKHLSGRLATTEDQLVERMDHLIEERDSLLRERSHYRNLLAEAVYQALTVEEIEGIPLLRGMIPDADMETLRGLTDRFRNRYPSGILVLASSQEDRPLLVAAVTQDLVECGLSAIDLIKEVAGVVGGSGGGRPTMAQAGGSDASKLPEALQRVDEWVRSHLR
ncbi:MAG: alanine--tRNA ligase [Chloroflexi bacterium RBG_16_48_8]|nr:MAG: alanine--tRNA ligase [Chloroflexi bacterium RBG_16_48_8]